MILQIFTKTKISEIHILTRNRKLQFKGNEVSNELYRAIPVYMKGYLQK